MTNDGSHSYTWDAEGRITRVDDGSNWTYAYNALGQRVSFEAGGTFDAVYDPAGNVLGTLPDQWRVRVLNRWVFSYANETYFTHVNNLGSVTMTMDHSGAVAGDLLLYPWGGPWLVNTPVGDFADMPFYDNLTDTHWTPARFYSANLVSWLSPDPLAGDVTNPQSLNRYAYVLNNPTSLVDPTGLSDCGNTDYPCNNNGEPPPGGGHYGGHGGGGGGGGGVPGGTTCVVDGVEEPCSTASMQQQASAVVPCPGGVCSVSATNQYGVTQFYKYWAFAGTAGVANGFYPGLGPQNLAAATTQSSLAGGQVTNHPVPGQGNQETGGSVWVDGRAGIYVTTFQPPGVAGEGSVMLSSSDVPSYGTFLGFWHSQIGAGFSPNDKGEGYTSWVGTPEGSVYKNTGGNNTCVQSGPTTTTTAGVTTTYPTCH